MPLIIMNEEIKTALGKDFDTISAKLPEGKDFVIVPKEDHIPKSRFDEVNTAAKDYKAKYEDVNKQFEGLKPLATGNDELTKKLKELQDQNAKTIAEYEGKILARDREYALNDTVKGYKPRNMKAVTALLDHTKIEFKDGKLIGATEQLEALKASDAYLFDLEQQQGSYIPPAAGIKPGQQPGGNGRTAEIPHQNEFPSLKNKK